MTKESVLALFSHNESSRHEGTFREGGRILSLCAVQKYLAKNP